MSRVIIISVLVISLLMLGSSPTPANTSPSDLSLANGLSLMPLEEKQNAIIELRLEEKASDAALAVAREIEDHWNDGAFDAALGLFDRLALLTDLDMALVSGTWRTPILTTHPDRFGTDALISSRDSVLEVEVEVHLETGNLIAIVLMEGEGWANKMFSVLSTDGGVTWYEKTFSVTGTFIESISAAMLDNYCYVAYNYNGQIKLMRYRYDTGHVEYWSPGVPELLIHTGDFGDVKLVTSDDVAGVNDLYVLIRHLTRELTLYRFDVSLKTFHWMNTSIADCDRGLDAVSGPSIWYPVFISYINQSDYAKVFRYEATQSKFVSKYSGYLWGSAPDATAISLYGIDVICIYEYTYTATSTTYLMGAYSVNLGDNWVTQGVSDYDDTRYEPNLTMRGGGGIALAYSRRLSFAKFGRTKWRPYDDPYLGSVSPTAYADNWTTGTPDIEYLGGGEHGIAYISSTSYRQAWFDRGSGCCNGDGLRGNVDDLVGPAGPIDVADLTFLVSYLFTGGPEPPCLTEGNVGGLAGPAGPIDVADLTYLVAYLFTGGPDPAECP